MSVIDSIPTYQVEGGAGRRVAAPALYKRTPGIYGALFDQALTTAEYGIAALGDSQSRYTPSVSYTPQSTVYGSKNSLATSLQLTAEMIVTQPSVKICHVVLGGFDTHQDEDTRQNALLAYVDSAVSAFMQDIANHGMADRVVLDDLVGVREARRRERRQGHRPRRGGAGVRRGEAGQGRRLR